MRREATAEQKAKAEERKAKFRGLAKRIAGLTEAERQAMAGACWPTTIEGHALSVTNACLLGLQLPSVSLVGGFRQWIKAGRAVRKGEHGLSIWVPAGSRKASDGDGKEDGEVFFIMGTVFDVSQTEEIRAETIQAPATCALFEGV